jgi:chromosome segregation protein
LYLKRLEILGFKSFADKVKLEFLPGVTAVVGPNGCGKSNIADALRWVLGEQSIKNLRGAKMDDVIFAGSEFRKPLGLAEVTLVLDNSDHLAALDFTEIAVTRRLFRSGLSEYLINKAPVRLRDIQELFFDTGLGKDAYSVIGQGKIDVILSAKAEERRSIFEEAAGIIKYKSRKQVAERKLEETDAGLLRLDDIITELNKQLGPLETQATLAGQYLNYQTELTVLEINYYDRELTKLQTGLAEIGRNKADLDEQYREFENQTNLGEADLETLRLTLINREEQLNRLHEDFYRIQNAIDKYHEQTNFQNLKLEDLAKQEAELAAGISSNLSRRQTMTAEQETLEREIELIQTRLVRDQQELAGVEERLKGQTGQVTRLEAMEQELKEALIAGLNETAALKNKANSAALQQNFLTRQLVDYQQKLTRLHEQRLDLEAKSRDKDQALQTVAAAIARNRQTQSELTGQMEELQTEIEKLEAENLDRQSQIRNLEGKISVLAEMEKSHQGYFQGVKALLDEAAGQPFHQAIHGVVADLIKVKSGMELALETALGSALQNVVIDHDRFAQEAIAYLKKQGKGRATFLPLNQVRVGEPRLTQYQAELELFGAEPALELVKFEPRHRQIGNYLLNQVVVAPTLQAAVALGAKLDRSFRVVTPEGDLVNPGGSITGGSLDRRRLGLLSRRREIEDLKLEKRETEARLAQDVIRVKDLREKYCDLRKRLATQQQQEQDGNLQRVALEREASALSHSLTQVLEESRLDRDELAELTAESEKFEAGQAELSEAMIRGEQQFKTIEEQLEKLAVDLNTAKKLKEELVSALSELKSSLSAGQQELHGKVVLKENVSKQAADVATSREHFQRKKAELEEERAQINLNSNELEAKKGAAVAQLTGQQELIDTAKGEKEQLVARLKELETKQRGFRRRSADLQSQIHRLDLAFNDRNSQIEHLQANLAEAYGAEWQAQHDPVWTLPEDAVKRINRLKNQLKELGPVNLAAIDDYRQVQERHEFLTAQSEDLTKARESLRKVINEIERTIEQRFRETFVRIRTEFQKLFAELFEGGHADLLLQEPDDVLNSGIEIVAQPPGKKLQSLSLLSGGERAMTAIALLFSILSIKPAPFCILDEIDAALDDANVQRFARLLEFFSVQSQFIVVTHRRGTMEVANALYGVTMEEMGISKLISLDLNQEKAG